MSVSVGRAKLMTALKTLHTRWKRARTDWNDRVAVDFENEFIEPLEQKIRRGIAAMENIREVLDRARRDCE